MKTQSVKLILMVLALLSIGLYTSCSKDDPQVVIDKGALETGIADANQLISSTTEGPAAGQYLPGSQAELQKAIDAAKAVSASAASTQAQVTNATVALAAAVETYQGKIVEEIDPDNLIAYWKFDEGTGTTVADASGNTHTGTLTVGHSSLGGGIPTWAADRKGVAAKALHFTNGGHIEVPSNTAFGPTEITIAMWVYLDSADTKTGIYSDNYMLAQNSYSGYKFQTQDGKKIFFTVKTAPDTYLNYDNGDVALKLKKWYHVAVTFKTGEMTFYLNGLQMVPQRTGLAGSFIALAERYDFVIGQELPNAKVDPEISWTLPHFEGSMDEIRMYKKVLSASQITAIYDQEKP